MASEYKKKPVVVEAVQWTGNNRAEMCEFIDSEVFEIIPRVGLVIHTLEGDHHASPGDYIIKGVNGEFYPCKPDIFAKTYESATLTPPNEWVSVDNKLPKNGVPVLIGNPHWDYPVVASCAGYGVWMDSWHQKMTFTPTCWMPLPAPFNRRPPEGEDA